MKRVNFLLLIFFLITMISQTYSIKTKTNLKKSFKMKLGKTLSQIEAKNQLFRFPSGGIK